MVSGGSLDVKQVGGLLSLTRKELCVSLQANKLVMTPEP